MRMRCAFVDLWRGPRARHNTRYAGAAVDCSVLELGQNPRHLGSTEPVCPLRVYSTKGTDYEILTLENIISGDLLLDSYPSVRQRSSTR